VEANLNSTGATCQLSIFIATLQVVFTFTRYLHLCVLFYYTGRSRFTPRLHSWRTRRKSNKKFPFKTAYFMRTGELTTSYYLVYDYTTTGYTDMYSMYLLMYSICTFLYSIHTFLYSIFVYC